MLDTTTALGRTLQEIAEAHGFSGAAGLVKAANHEDRPMEDFPWMGFGSDLESVIGFDEEERTRIVKTFAQTYLGRKTEESLPAPSSTTGAAGDTFPIGDTNTTNETYPRFARDLDPTKGLERGLPCFVYHEDAGGRCARTATMRVYGLAFCEPHGEEVRAGALMEAYADAAYFFDRFRNPHTPDFNEVIERELLAAVHRMNDAGPTDEDYQGALRRAYPDVPEKVRAGILRWEEDTDYAREFSPEDHLLDTLATMHKLLRLAFEDGESWLVEVLEYERESVAAQAAYALRERAEARPAG